MHARVTTIALVAVLGIALLASPAMAQVMVRVQNPQFSWTGKEGQQANYEWSATIDNPSRRDVRVRVTLQFVDDTGAVIASDSEVVSVTRESDAQVDGASSISYSDARNAVNYRIALAAAAGEG